MRSRSATEFHHSTPSVLWGGQLRQPATIAHSPRSDDALLRLQESLQTRRADLEGWRPPAEAAQGPRVRVGAGGDGVVLGDFLAVAACGRRGGGGGGRAGRWSGRWSGCFRGADGRRVKPFEASGGVRGRESRNHVWAVQLLQRKTAASHHNTSAARGNKDRINTITK